MVQQRFRERCRQIIFGLCEENPVTATFMGIDSFDSVLPRTDELSRNRYRQQKRHFLKGLEEFSAREEELDPGQRIDLALLTSLLQTELYTEEHFQYALRRPDFYPGQALYGVYFSILRGSKDPKLKFDSIVNRLREIPRLLDEGRENLARGSNIPDTWLQIGLGMSASAPKLFDQITDDLDTISDDGRDALDAATEEANRAFSSYREFLSDELTHRCDGDFAIGEESFNYLLEHKHGLSSKAKELQEIGYLHIEKAKELLSRKAKEISPDADWKELLAELKADHPEADNLLLAYRNAVDAALDFVKSKGLVTIPDRQELIVEPTPGFQRLLIPYAAFVPPPVFSGEQRGVFWVTPVNTEMPESEQEQQLQGHNSWSIPIIALHEGYPGHHLQFCRAGAIENVIRHFTTTSVFVEGWALYCEEMMRQEGYYTDPRMEMLQLKDQLWRAVRVVVDVGLHCYGMRKEEAVEMLVEEAGLEMTNAITEVNRYTISPTQPMSYLIGKLELMQLRKDTESLEKNNFSLRDFHDSLLSFGGIPFKYIRKEMLPA